MFIKWTAPLCFIFLLSNCDLYTVKNNYNTDIIAGSVVLKPQQCVEFFDFPLIGDFPMKFKNINRQLLSDKLYPPAHYIVSDEGKILKQDTACEIEVLAVLTPKETEESTLEKKTPESNKISDVDSKNIVSDSKEESKVGNTSQEAEDLSPTD